MADLQTALRQAQAEGADRLDAQLLLLSALGTPATDIHHRRSWLLAHGDDVLAPDAADRFATLLRRRLDGEPLAYLTGHKEFFGLDLLVDARVLVPRPDTEILVEWALEVLHDEAARHPPGTPLAALDLGTGSGAIALALLQQLPALQMDAVDASEAAVAVARQNAQRLGLRLQVLRGHWLAPVQRRYHCIVSNPPYIAEHDAHLPALAHEPLQALVSGADGLDDIRHIVAHAPVRLEDGAWLLLEHGFDQAAAVRALLRDGGFAAVQSRHDLAGHERCTGGRWLRP
ncbi:MAG: peptide chain release factor N(5)-glutamine methyltransferase [Pseudomonadota bacterium]